MSQQSKGKPFEDWAIRHPRQASQWAVSLLVVAWQLPVAVLGWALFLLLSRLLKLPWWWLLLAGAGTLFYGIVLQGMESGWDWPSLPYFLEAGILSNWGLIEAFAAGGLSGALHYLYAVMLGNLLLFSLLLAGTLAALDLIPNSRHEKALRALQRGQVSVVREGPHPRRLEAALSQLAEEGFNGTLLGLSKLTQNPVVVPDNTVNQMVLVLGTTGGGKTITLRRFYRRALRQGYPLIIVDGKPTDENVTWLRLLAQELGRPFYGFNCAPFHHYDCLAQGGHTELKDKIISLKDEWASDYYRSIAEDYLQTTFEVLIKGGGPFDLKTVVACLNYEELAVKTRAIDDKKLMERVQRLDQYDKKDITGLQAHLNLLIHSELGHYFERNDHTFSLTEVVQNQGVVYFALPALSFPRFATVLGKLVINDIKAVVGRLSASRLFTVFDEFSVFAGEQVLNLVNMGRGKGVHAILRCGSDPGKKLSNVCSLQIVFNFCRCFFHIQLKYAKPIKVLCPIGRNP